MNGKVVYTIKFGSYDPLRDPGFITPGWDYICFTNMDISSDVWEVRKVYPNLPDFLAARYVYINSHLFVPGYSSSLLLGGQVQATGDLDEFFRKNGGDSGADFNLLRHPGRCCVYKEANLILREGIDRSGRVEKQMSRYRAAGFPEDFGLFAHGIIWRRNTREVAEHNQLWWKEVMLGSYRDQLSFMYVLWRYGLATVNPFTIGYWDTWKSEWFNIYHHGNDTVVTG